MWPDRRLLFARPLAASLPGVALLLQLLLLLAGCSDQADPGGHGPDRSDPDRFEDRAFATPAREHHPFVRWWWPGGAVEPAEVEAEIQTLADAGFGGVEVQAFARVFSPSELDRGVLTWGSPHFHAALAAGGEAARARGLAFDVTLGSAWPASAPTIDEAPARQLVLGHVDVAGPRSFTGPLPPPVPQMLPPLVIGKLAPFDEDVTLVAVVAAEIVDAAVDPPVLDHFTDVRAAFEAGGWRVPAGTWRLFAVYENDTRQLADGAAYPVDSVVVDHLRRRGAQELLAEVGDPLLDGAGAIDAVFVDSFELSAELPWTGDLLERFRDEKGYDPTAYLPLLFRKGGEPEPAKLAGVPLPARFAAASGAGPRVREDYEDVRGEAFLDEHVAPLQEWATRRGVALRLQAHGGFAHLVDAYAAVDIPESEGLAAAGTYDFLKLAASGAHVSGRRVVGSESFVGLIPDARGLTREDLFLLAGRAASAGITRLVYHGFTYRFALDGGEEWYPWEGQLRFSSRIDEAHPVWPALPQMNQAFARTAYALTRGRHAADVAWLHAESDRRGSLASFGSRGAIPRGGESAESRSILEAGLVYDRVSPRGLESTSTETDPGSGRRSVFRVGEATYRALLIDQLDATSPELLAAVERLGDAGIPVIVTGDLPARARGWADHERQDELVRAAVERLAPRVLRAPPGDAGAALRTAGLVPAVEAAGGEALGLSPERRALADGDLVLLFNESDEDLTQRLRVNLPGERLRVFDPERAAAIADLGPRDDRTLVLEVPARRSRLLVVQRAP